RPVGPEVGEMADAVELHTAAEVEAVEVVVVEVLEARAGVERLTVLLGGAVGQPGEHMMIILPLHEAEIVVVEPRRRGVVLRAEQPVATSLARQVEVAAAAEIARADAG